MTEEAQKSSQAQEEKQLPVEVFQTMERRDENQILAEMRGEFLEELVYDIEIGGRRVTNLSYAGVKEATRRRGNIEILEVRTEESDNEIRALVRVRDHDNRIDVLGASAAEKSKPFAYTLAVNKAERNAFAKLIPAKWYAVLIDEWLQRHGHKPAQPQPTTPVRKTTETVVPITKEAITQPGIKQFPLIEGTTAVGMLNVSVDGKEATLVPEKPVNAEDPAVKNFLVPRIFDALKQKYPDFQHSLRTECGYITSILLRGPLDDPHVKEIANAAKWAFLRAWERERQPDK
mgnify:CR=1 FL=1